jgi:hypothetical protein
MINKQILKDLQEIIEDNLDPSMFPYRKGNSIRIGKFVIRESRYGFLVYDIEANRQIAKTFCKTAAVALAKNLNKGRDNTQKVLHLDSVIEKHYNDCVFYKHTIRKTKDEFKKEIITVRYEIAKSITSDAKKRLDSFIFS